MHVICVCRVIGICILCNMYMHVYDSVCCVVCEVTSTYVYYVICICMSIYVCVLCILC